MCANDILVNLCPLSDVVSVECVGRSNDDLGGLNTNGGVSSQNDVGVAVVSGELFVHSTGGLAVDDSLDGVCSGLTNFDGVPQEHVGAGQVSADVAVHFGGQTQTSNLDGGASVLDSLSASQDTNGGP